MMEGGVKASPATAASVARPTLTEKQTTHSVELAIESESDSKMVVGFFIGKDDLLFMWL